MTRIRYCRCIICQWNNQGYCDNEEISLDSEGNCESFVYEKDSEEENEHE